MGQREQWEKDREHVLGAEKELHLELQAASISEWGPPTRLHVAEHLIQTSLASLLSQTSLELNQALAHWNDFHVSGRPVVIGHEKMAAHQVPVAASHTSQEKARS